MKLPRNFEICNKTKYANRYIQNIVNTVRKDVGFWGAKDLIGSHDSRLRCLQAVANHSEVIEAEMITEAIAMNRKNMGYLIVDTTILKKPYAEKMEGVSLQYSGSELVLGISATVILFVNSDGMLVVGSFVWQTGDDSRLKTAANLAIHLSQQIGCDYVLADGAFISLAALNRYASSATHYVMRMHSNRLITVDGLTANLIKHPAFMMKRNQRQIVRDAQWHGLKIRIVALKFNHKTKGSIRIFLVTNLPFKRAKNAGNYYKNRWKIETFFRTVKQKFTLNKCLSRSLKLQHAHCIAVFAAHRYFEQNGLSAVKKPLHPKKVRIKMQISRTRMSQYYDPIRSLTLYA